MLILCGDKLLLCLLLLFVVCGVIQSFPGISIEDNLKVRCRLHCTINLDTDDGNLYCNSSCQTDQCLLGCSVLYQEAITSVSCADVCIEWLQQNVTNTMLSESVTQAKMESCAEGCAEGLDTYYQLKYARVDLPSPIILKDSISDCWVLLEWTGDLMLEDMSFIVQKQVVDLNTGWHLHGDIESLPFNIINVTNLHPYLTYKFKLVFKLTSNIDHSRASLESRKVTTLPFGVPSSGPTIVSLTAPSATVISMSWRRPIYINGPLLSYRLTLRPLEGSKEDETVNTVSYTVTSWIFGHLQPGVTYKVTIAAVNSDGSGPTESQNVATPPADSLKQKEMPYLVLGADNFVVKQRLHQLTHEAEQIVKRSLLVIGVGVDIDNEVVLVSDDSSQVTLLKGDRQVEDVYPNLIQPSSIDIDWLNNMAYVVDGYRIYQCTVKLAGNRCKVATDITPLRPREVKVDPINGYLYYTVMDSKKGLHRVDLADFNSDNVRPELLISADLDTFFIDFTNLLIYLPNNTQNTIMSAYLDGSGVQDIRRGAVARPHFVNIESMVLYDDKFFWTNGSKVFSEEYDKGNRTYYHNTMLLFEKHFRGFNLYTPSAQPVPAPVNAPVHVEVLFTAQKAIIRWDKPDKLNFQGMGAYSKWDYEVRIEEKVGYQMIPSSGDMQLVVSDLQPDTEYTVKVRATSTSGTGPWSQDFHGKTLTDELNSVKLLVAVEHRYIMEEIREVGIDGELSRVVTETSRFDSSVTDIAWSEDKIFWTTKNENVWMYDDDKKKLVHMEFVRNAVCVTYDWLAQQLYWSVFKQAVIRRADIYGKKVEFVYQALARDMTIDSVEGRLYWVTMTTVEMAYLNGHDHLTYFSLPYFSGRQVISVTVDVTLKKLYWYVKGYEGQSLYTADLAGHHSDHKELLRSVRLVGQFDDIGRESKIQYFSERLFWMDTHFSVMVGDTFGNYTSVVPGIDSNVTMFALAHPSLHPYPENLNGSTVKVVPDMVSPDTVMCVGTWQHFNITWRAADEVNHGKVWYEVSVLAPGIFYSLTVTDEPWVEMEGLAPFVPIEVSVCGFTYWGSAAVMETTVNAPMAAPSQPQSPRVYVTQRKNAAQSKVMLAADFRWHAPDQINGIMERQNVYYWHSAAPTHTSSTTLSPSARHFVLDSLLPNVTYFFQVECCTPVGCSPLSDVVNATADAINPVPKLLIATGDTVIEAEPDNVVNTSVTVATKSVVAMSYLADEDTYYWVTRQKYLEQFGPTGRTRLGLLEGDDHSMMLDWISRTVYIVATNSTSSTISRYQLDESTLTTVLERQAHIGHAVVDPYTSMLVWSEQADTDGTYTLIRADTAGTNIRDYFRQRSRRATDASCSCATQQHVAGAIAVDLSGDGRTEVVYVDTGTLTVLAADMEGCQCRILLTTTEGDRKGLPPDYLTVDHVNVYWYHTSSSSLYSMDKATNKLTVSKLTGVASILAFGSHLQPLPGSECLDTSPYTDDVSIMSITNTSAMVSLREVSWPKSCDRISEPVVKYTVHYREMDDMNPNANCQAAADGHQDLQCYSQVAYSNDMKLNDLKPYTYYILQGAVSNHFSEFAAMSLGKPTTARTKPGVPSPVYVVAVLPLSPNSFTISWYPPLPANGPVEHIVYNVHWSTQQADGVSHSRLSDVITYEAFNEFNSQFEQTVDSLIANQSYIVKVISTQTEGGYQIESDPVEVLTYEEPADLELTDVTNTSIRLSWRIPSDSSVNMVSIYYREVRVSTFTKDDYPTRADNRTFYNRTFTGLKPNTDYFFRLNLIYFTSGSMYHWPPDGGDLTYIYKTLTGVPGVPSPPIVEEFKTGEFDVSWPPANNHGKEITLYLLQYKLIDKDNWSLACNSTGVRWMVDERVIRRGYTYVFRVKAKNANGWGPYSTNSSMFSYPILEPEPRDSMFTMVLVVGSFILLILVIAVIALVLFVKRRKEERKRRKKKNSEFIAVSQGPDLELATLRELPMTAIQQNTLYAINMIPTDDEIAALPHFRRDQLVLCKFLGSGAFGEVFEGVAKNILNESSGDTKCAVKTLRKSASDQEKEEFLKEALLMSNFHHRHILSLLGVCLDNDPQFIILELMEGGDLLSFMRACRLSSIQNHAELSMTDLVKVCVHVSNGCKYLQDMHFVHRDLAARNCLVSSCDPATMVVKIGDFGLARDIYKNDYYRKEGEGLLPVRWMSPESLVDGVFTTQSDIWAFGVLMWEVVTFGQQPYPARTNIEVLHFVRSGGLLDRPENCPDGFYQLMCKCWAFAPEDRPPFLYLLQQLEQLQTMCESMSEYLIPIRSNPGPIATVGGYKYRQTQRSRRHLSTSSDGPDYRQMSRRNDSHVAYGKIHRATSFDDPNPKDATPMIQTDSSNYLEPQCRHVPPYVEILPDWRTQNYMYNSNGERIREKDTMSVTSHSSNPGPLYVQTTVKENFYPNSTDFMKCAQQKANSADNGQGSCDEVYRIFSHQQSSADSVIMKTIENIPSVCGEMDCQMCSNEACSHRTKADGKDVTYAQVMHGIAKKSNHFRKQRLDSGNSIMSFDSVQTEPAYSDSRTQRNKLYSSSSSRSNYSMTNISESIAEQMSESVNRPDHIGEEPEIYWTEASNCTAMMPSSPMEDKGHVGYLNVHHGSHVYPDHMLAGYDMVQASLV